MHRYLDDQAERREWLKHEHQLGTNAAWWIAERAAGKGGEDGDPEAYLAAAVRYVEEQYSGKKAGLRPIYDALLALGKAAESGTVPTATHKLIQLRVSQINGCSVCVDMHARELKEAGEKDERIWGVGAWRESPYFTDTERAALALAESVTRLADTPDAVPDDIWDDAADLYDEKELSSLLLSISVINVWNRLNGATRQPVRAAE